METKKIVGGNARLTNRKSRNPVTIYYAVGNRKTLLRNETDVYMLCKKSN